jgi:hypothetical protein
MRIRRHTGTGFGVGGDPGGETDPTTEPSPSRDRWRRFARDLGLVALVALVGYGISAYWVSPGAVFASEHAVPRVLELSEADARERLTGLGFRVRLDGERATRRFRGGRSSGRTRRPTWWCLPTARCSWC